VERVTGIEPA